MAPERMLIDGHSVGQFDGGFNLFRERFGPEVAQRYQSGFHHARYQSRKNAGYRNNTFQSARIEREDLARPGPVLHEKFRGRELRHRAHACDGVDLAGLGANQDRRFAAHSECENSATAAANKAATPASTAFPPWKKMRMPASSE